MHYLAYVDPDGGLTATALGDLKTFITGTLGIALFALVVAGVGIAMGVRWLKKGAHQS
jgi:hypothetical protein